MKASSYRFELVSVLPSVQNFRPSIVRLAARAARRTVVPSSLQTMLRRSSASQTRKATASITKVLAVEASLFIRIPVVARVVWLKELVEE